MKGAGEERDEDGWMEGRGSAGVDGEPSRRGCRDSCQEKKEREEGAKRDRLVREENGEQNA